MKLFGYLLISVGLALLIVFTYSWWHGQQGVVSPIPEDKGVKVIYITPTK